MSRNCNFRPFIDQLPEKLAATQTNVIPSVINVAQHIRLTNTV